MTPPMMICAGRASTPFSTPGVGLLSAACCGVGCGGEGGEAPPGGLSVDSLSVDSLSVDSLSVDRDQDHPRLALPIGPSPAVAWRGAGCVHLPCGSLACGSLSSDSKTTGSETTGSKTTGECFPDLSYDKPLTREREAPPTSPPDPSRAHPALDAVPAPLGPLAGTDSVSPLLLAGSSPEGSPTSTSAAAPPPRSSSPGFPTWNPDLAPL